MVISDKNKNKILYCAEEVLKLEPYTINALTFKLYTEYNLKRIISKQRLAELLSNDDRFKKINSKWTFIGD